MPDALTVRRAVIDDVEELAALKRRVAADAYGPHVASDRLQAWLQRAASPAHFRYRLARRDYHVLVAQTPGGRIVGVATLRQRGLRADGNAGGVYVLEPGRGVGALLDDARMSVARELGCVRMRVAVFRFNAHAQGFVQARGFVRGRGYREHTLDVMADHYERGL